MVVTTALMLWRAALPILIACLVAATARDEHARGRPSGVRQDHALLSIGVGAGAQQGHRVVGYVFDENRNLLLERGAALGHTIQEHFRSGQLCLEQVDPAEISPGELTTRIRKAVEKDRTTVIVIDSLNGYLKAMPDEDYLALQLHELRTYLGQQGVISLLILSQSGGMGSVQAPVDISYLADGVIMLRYYEAAGEIKKAIAMLKKRTGPHEHAIRDFHIDSDGVRIGQPLRHIQGVLTGLAHHERLGQTL